LTVGAIVAVRAADRPLAGDFALKTHLTCIDRPHSSLKLRENAGIYRWLTVKNGTDKAESKRKLTA